MGSLTCVTVRASKCQQGPWQELKSFSFYPGDRRGHYIGPRDVGHRPQASQLSLSPRCDAPRAPGLVPQGGRCTQGLSVGLWPKAGWGAGWRDPAAQQCPLGPGWERMRARPDICGCGQKRASARAWPGAGSPVSYTPELGPWGGKSKETPRETSRGSNAFPETPGVRVRASGSAAERQDHLPQAKRRGGGWSRSEDQVKRRKNTGGKPEGGRVNPGGTAPHPAVTLRAGVDTSGARSRRRGRLPVSRPVDPGLCRRRRARRSGSQTALSGRATC